MHTQTYSAFYMRIAGQKTRFFENHWHLKASAISKDKHLHSKCCWLNPLCLTERNASQSKARFYIFQFRITLNWHNTHKFALFIIKAFVCVPFCARFEAFNICLMCVWHFNFWHIHFNENQMQFLFSLF